MDNQLPFGVKYARFLNYSFTNIVLVLIGIGATRQYFIRAEEAGRPLNISDYMGIMLVVITVAIPIYLIHKHNISLCHFKPRARTIQIILSVVGLIVLFPLGVIFYGICLYFFLIDASTKVAFTIKKHNLKE